MTLQLAGEVEFEQHRAHQGRRQGSHPDQVVDRNGARSKQADDARTIACQWIAFEGLAVRLVCRKRDRSLHDRPDRQPLSLQHARRL